MSLFTIKITEERLQDLQILPDDELRQLGIDPDSVYAASVELAEERLRQYWESTYTGVEQPHIVDAIE